MTWAVERSAGSAAAFHGREVPDPARRAVWVFDVAGPALVLGSTQPLSVVVPGALVEVVRRRSGGGAVLLVPGAVVWIDVIVPRGDVLWDDDVGRASWWLGRAWVRALGACGVAGAQVHTGPLVRTRWSGLVCFAGLGPGEVTVDGVKAVGISQRRTRSAARFQCCAYLRWDPVAMVDVLAEPRPAPEELAGCVFEVGAPTSDVESAFLAELAAT